MTLSAHADGILLVTRLNIVRRPMLDELRWQLKTSPAPKLGYDTTRSGDAVAYGNGFGYPYGYGSDPEETEEARGVAAAQPKAADA